MRKKTMRIKSIIVLLIIVIIALAVITGVLYKQNTAETKSNENYQSSDLNQEKNISDYEVEEILKNYLKLSGAFQGSPYSVLEVMKEITGKNVVNEEYPESIKYNGESIIPTNIKYSEFKEFMLNYMTEDLFKKNFEKGYVDKDGDLYFKDIGATGIEYYIKNIEKIGESSLKYNGIVNCFYEEEYKSNMEILFEIKNISDKYVISSIDMSQENN